MQNLLPTMISCGYHDRGLPLTRIAELTASRPAQLFGMYPRKGVIQVGSDADFAIVDLNETAEITAATQFSASAYTPWEGWQMKGRVRHTILRGQTVFSVDRDFGAPTGQFVSRRHSGETALAELA
jgi:dihydropyrimidinase